MRARTEADFARDVERLCEVNRQRKALEAEASDLGALLMSELDDAQETRWENEFLSIGIAEQPGRESADVKALKAAGLGEYVKRGAPFRTVTARRK